MCRTLFEAVQSVPFSSERISSSKLFYVSQFAVARCCWSELESGPILLWLWCTAGPSSGCGLTLLVREAT